VPRVNAGMGCVPFQKAVRGMVRSNG
jgi:hypothetical protein